MMVKPYWDCIFMQSSFFAPSVTCRILLGWEFGGGFGHVVNLREIARHIGETQSCEFLFALQKPQSGLLGGVAGPVGDRSTCVQALGWQQKKAIHGNLR